MRAARGWRAGPGFSAPALLRASRGLSRGELPKKADTARFKLGTRTRTALYGFTPHGL